MLTDMTHSPLEEENELLRTVRVSVFCYTRVAKICQQLERNDDDHSRSNDQQTANL